MPIDDRPLGSVSYPGNLTRRQIRCHHIRVTPDLTGRAVVVTGGTKGLGRVLTEWFHKAGADVLVCARQPADTDAEFIAADVRDPEQAAAVIDAATKRFGRLDIVLNN